VITLNDYSPESSGAMGGGEFADQAELLKAMQAGSITGRDTVNQPLTQEPLKIESLEQTIRLLESRTQDIKLFNAIPKLVAHNTVEEYLQLSSYGNMSGGFYGEGALSDVQDSTYIRRSEQIKYIQVTGEVTLQAQMVKSYVDAYTQEVKNKAMWVMKKANSALTKANSDVVPEEFNSLYKQHAAIGVGAGFLYATFEDYYNSGVVIDLRGKSLKQGDVEDGALKIDANFGNVDSVFAPTTVLSALTKDYYNTQRIMQGGSATQMGTGNIKSLSTTIGDVNIMTDKFMAKNPPKKLSTPADNAKAPAAPATVAVAVAADALSKYQAGEAGNVFYAVAAINSFGESALTAFATAVAISAGNASDITITSGGGAVAGTGYVIYRSKVGVASAAVADFFPIFKVSNADVTAGYNGGAGGKVRDRGYFLPDTEEAFITEISDEILSLKQLAPLSKLDLAVISMSRRFISFMFCTPILYTPKKLVRYINVSRTYTA
jgi:hypothetical protein